MSSQLPCTLLNETEAQIYEKASAINQLGEAPVASNNGAVLPATSHGIQYERCTVTDGGIERTALSK